MATKYTLRISFSESTLSVLSQIYVQLKVENTKNSETINLKYAVNQLVNTLFSLPCKGLRYCIMIIRFR
jgi:hypothetical protein